MSHDNPAVFINESGIATLTILDGGPLNIMGSRAAKALTGQLRSLALDPAVKVLIIRGTGSKTFMGGADIKEMMALDPDSARGFIRSLYELCEAVRVFPVPTIAQIDGWCIGVGLEFVASCDVRYASSVSRFTMPEVRIGIPSVIQGALLSRLVGEGRARWLMLSGNDIDASTALAWGLLNEVDDSENLSDRVMGFARDLAACGAAGMRMQKRLLIEWEAPHLDAVIRKSIDRFGDVFESGEPRSYMSEFFQKKHG